MTTPDVPLRMELRFELPGTPEQVWDAIATSGGISSWFLPTDVEERVGGAIVTHTGEEDSPGAVTGWELGVERAGQAVELHGLRGEVDRLGEIELHGLRGEVDRLGEIELLVRLTGAHPGFFALYSYDKGDGTVMTGVRAYLFSEDASTAVERERAAWRSWLEGLAASVG